MASSNESHNSRVFFILSEPHFVPQCCRGRVFMRKTQRVCSHYSKPVTFSGCALSGFFMSSAEEVSIF